MSAWSLRSPRWLIPLWFAGVLLSGKAQSNSETRERAAPTAAELATLGELEAEARVFEAGARDFRRTLDLIVVHHYEERRRRLLQQLDQQIMLEQERVMQARETAMRRLEEFIARYDGPKADPEATPEAMFRLAALHEEKARGSSELDLAKALEPAVQLYRSIIATYPGYSEIAGVHYYLGHAYFDAGRLEEAQQVWRATVCRNRFEVRPDPTSPSRVLLQALPQDHDDAFWNDWYAKNPVPLDQRSLSDRPRERREEQVFVDPYAGCEALPQQVKPREEPRYLAEIWWQLGNIHFDQLDPGAGPYAFNRAASAYDRSLEYEKPPLRGVAMYKRAWTFYKQQRYRAAVAAFVELLRYVDAQEKETGEAGTDFRSEAYTYLAAALTYADFDGPPPEHPYIPRSDVLDEETDPVRAEARLRIAIDRVQDPALIPQEEKWTAEIYKALAQEFNELTQHRNAIATLELMLKKFPLDRDAPSIRDRVADLYDDQARLAPDGSLVREEAIAAALKARTQLADYVGDTAWTRANKHDVEALYIAEQLVRRGLQRAAADHTNTARAHVTKARQLSDEWEQRRLLERAVEEYAMAAKGWTGYLGQDPNAIDAYETRFWLADSAFWVVMLELELGKEPSAEALRAAHQSARGVRDSNEDDRYLQPAAYYLVALSDRLLDHRHREYVESGGQRGFQRQEQVSFSGEGEGRKPVRLKVPAEALAAVTAREEYNQTIAFEDDPEKNGPLYAFQAADTFFVYGNFDQARERFEKIYEARCGVDEWGYKAWEKLISMSNFEGDAARSRALVEAKSCAFDEATRVAEEAIRTPVRQGVAYLDARQVYDAAEKAPDGEARKEKWREAAALYKLALDAAPDRDEAPEAAMNGAYAYKQVGEYDKAIEMYELFISRYGNDQKLRTLRDGDPEKELAAEPGRYQNRVEFLKMAYDALANAYVLFFDYPKAAKSFDAVSKSEHFEPVDRVTAAQQAINLYASLGDEPAMVAARDAFVRLGAGPRDLAEADFVVASAALKRWDQHSPDAGANATARRTAKQSMQRFYDARKDQPEAQAFVVEAAYWMAKLERAGSEPGEAAWWQRAMAAFSQFKANAATDERGLNTALGSRQANMAAEGAFTLLDEELRRRFDYDAGQHRFRGTPQEVLTGYQEAAKRAKAYYDQLQTIFDQYGSPEWGTAAVARQGSLYDSLRSGLYNTRPPELVMFDAKTEALLKRAEESDNFDLQERADAVRVKVENAWRDQRDRELASADQIAVDRYGNAVMLARRYNLSTPAVARAIRRLAFLTDVVGDDKLGSYAARVDQLDYRPGMFLRLRPGMVTAPPPDGLPAPSPKLAGEP